MMMDLQNVSRCRCHSVGFKYQDPSTCVEQSFPLLSEKTEVAFLVAQKTHAKRLDKGFYLSTECGSCCEHYLTANFKQR